MIIYQKEKQAIDNKRKGAALWEITAMPKRGDMPQAVWNEGGGSPRDQKRSRTTTLFPKCSMLGIRQ
ncbi:hypothetical protein DAPPUDRAFT_256492 [Daphnia pulex]|uniref:Uncharacterized protein n=1 Tax=Daphnia pulex TaxID=6669 RepID=E9HBH1_DAPPU|nr:hypothetical protein DAPPUDRAFT_256492 [Daphnia pulex]|eukprot:EFX70841.1 hypothetical protein DAPPUDRAFT_256492 [Daphnia pulex]